MFLLDAPHTVQWVATHVCDLRCEHCMVAAGEPHQDKELTTKEIFHVIDEMILMKVRQFSVTGGEPLKRKDIFDVLRKAKQGGIKISLATNGSLVDFYQKELSDAQIDSVMVSVDGSRETHDSIRRQGSFDKAIKAISFFKEIGVPLVSVSTTIYTRNIEELTLIKDIVKKSGADYWSINILIPEGRAKGRDELFLSNNKMKKLLQFVADSRKEFPIGFCSEAGYLGEWGQKVRGDKTFFCSCGWNSCAIMANGDVMACPVFDDNDYVAGNIRKKSFEKIWNKGFKSFRDFQYPDSCVKCSLFKKCRGGCKVMRILNADCYKDVWSKKE